MAEFKLDSKMTFGKYKGRTVEWVLESDPEYLIWACDNIDWFELHYRAMEALLDATMIWEDDDWDNEWEDGHPLNFGDR